ncbi:hypothetical protein Sste5346_007814 [Sporothrix stenoceras]|uniref:Uncharacterized protein n=1 Tax=Sporothrix stenoceras TaxID=5173 RepID=A0ABR3YS92_9PEZI
MSNKTAKTTTTISSIDEAKEEDKAKIAPTHSVLPLLEPPSEFEAKYYYYTLGSHPRLVGRTSSGTTPWWRLVKNDEETKVLEIEAARWGPATGLDTATSYGRVDKHAIH